MGAFSHESEFNILTRAPGSDPTELLGWLFKAWGKWWLLLMERRCRNGPGRIFEDKRLREVVLLEWTYSVKPKNSPAHSVHLEVQRTLPSLKC